MKHFWRLGFLSCMGCYGGLVYATHVPVEMSLLLKIATAKAALDWETKTKAQLNVHVDACPSEPRGLSEICIHPVDHVLDIPWEPGELTGYTVANEVWIAAPQLEAEEAQYRQRLIAHELGHAMGLQHDVEGTLMYPYRDKGSLVVTARDAAQWAAIHGGVKR